MHLAKFLHFSQKVVGVTLTPKLHLSVCYTQDIKCAMLRTSTTKHQASVKIQTNLSLKMMDTWENR